jgi:oxygen-independent coproporphyrinogen-3 oxidase
MNSKRFRWSADLPDYLNDVPEIVRAYAPYIVLSPEADEELNLTVRQERDCFLVGISVGKKIVREEKLAIAYEEGLLYKKLTKRFCKNALHDWCKEITGVELPYGSLTGVRPTKLYYELMQNNGNPEEVLRDTFFVSPDRARLIAEVVANQSGYYDTDPHSADIFVNIPFCATRCRYCSFISSELSQVRKKIPAYIAAVREELSAILKKIKEENLFVRAVYVGGGTPTSLEADELKSILEPVAQARPGVEFTVEAGRPDSFSREKLEMLASMGVTRISINPQTFKARTLCELGRAHTPEQVYLAFSLSREFGFDINMDLIAGLPGEDFEDFSDSLKKTLSLRPENITIHTLSIKRGAVFRNDGMEKNVQGIVKKCVDFARAELKSAGYLPYYMYRQKNMADNLENVGYCLPGKQCLYNIDYMEETTTVLSAGAGAMSKYVHKDENRIERLPNAKGLDDYLAKKGV